jgi:hypothetical protein
LSEKKIVSIQKGLSAFSVGSRIRSEAYKNQQDQSLDDEEINLLTLLLPQNPPFFQGCLEAEQSEELYFNRFLSGRLSGVLVFESYSNLSTTYA